MEAGKVELCFNNYERLRIDGNMQCVRRAIVLHKRLSAAQTGKVVQQAKLILAISKMDGDDVRKVP